MEATKLSLIRFRPGQYSSLTGGKDKIAPLSSFVIRAHGNKFRPQLRCPSRAPAAQHDVRRVSKARARICSLAHSPTRALAPPPPPACALRCSPTRDTGTSGPAHALRKRGDGPRALAAARTGLRRDGTLCGPDGSIRAHRVPGPLQGQLMARPTARTLGPPAFGCQTWNRRVTALTASAICGARGRHRPPPTLLQCTP